MKTMTNLVPSTKNVHAHTNSTSTMMPRTKVTQSQYHHHKPILVRKCHPRRRWRYQRPSCPKMSDTPESTKNLIPSSISTPSSPSKQVAKVKDVDHLADLAYDISTVIGPRDTAENDDLLTHSSLKRENQIRRKRQERKLRRLTMTREKNDPFSRQALSSEGTQSHGHFEKGLDQSKVICLHTI